MPTNINPVAKQILAPDNPKPVPKAGTFIIYNVVTKRANKKSGKIWYTQDFDNPEVFLPDAISKTAETGVKKGMGPLKLLAIADYAFEWADEFTAAWNDDENYTRSVIHKSQIKFLSDDTKEPDNGVGHWTQLIVENESGKKLILPSKNKGVILGNPEELGHWAWFGMRRRARDLGQYKEVQDAFLFYNGR